MAYNTSAAERIVARFKDGAGTYSPTASYVSEIKLVLGVEPSYAVVHVPMAASGETAPQVAGISTGPLSKIKVGTPVMCYHIAADTTETLCFSGYAVKISQDFVNDSLVVTCYDHRWLLKGVPVVGTYYSSGDGTSLTYCQARPCIMNEDGLPNCTLTTVDGVDVECFCEPNLGLAAGDAPGTIPAAGKACYWTPKTAWRYIATMQAWTALSAISNAVASFPWLNMAPGSVAINISAADELELDTDGFNTSRKAQELNLEGVYLGAALHKICQMSGPFTIFIEPNANPIYAYCGTVQIHRTRYAAESPVDVSRRVAGTWAKLDGVYFTEGEYTEDGEETFTNAVVAGKPVYIERRVTLLPAWSDADFASWTGYMDTAKTGGTAASDYFAEANSKYPGVCRDYYIDPAWDYTAGTTQSGKPLATRLRTPQHELASSYLTGSDVKFTDLLSARMPIKFEVSDDGGTTWYLLDDSDGLTIRPDGIIQIPGARLAGKTFNTWTDTLETKLADPSSITENTIRATLLIPCEHRTIKARALSCDPLSTSYTPAGSVDAYTGTTDDTARAYTGLCRQFYTVNDNYSHIIRKDSYPTPQAAGGTAQNDGGSAYLDDTSYLDAHCNRRLADYGRIVKSGHFSFPHLLITYRPGAQIRNVINVAANDTTTTSTVNAVAVAVVFRCGPSLNSTEYILG